MKICLPRLKRFSRKWRDSGWMRDDVFAVVAAIVVGAAANFPPIPAVENCSCRGVAATP